ncbi:HAD-IIB family hydrolase [Enorma phocaeensis]|uniref:HAD-IIB family hydrolase n=1 Tax=Enorma phocaeensis TaxID=1871019 RepID=UPI0023549174|nr:HAD-IIB family hydrolase [Enorma phocaeensis]
MAVFDRGRRIELVASDMDGTLIHEAGGLPSARAIELIERLMDHGVIFVAASGRRQVNLERLFAPIADRIGYVCENGGFAQFRDHRPMIREFEQDDIEEICRLGAERACQALIEGPYTSYAPSSDTDLLRYMREEVGYEMRAIERLEDIDEPIIKISYFVDPTRTKSVCEFFQREFEGRFSVMTSGPIWIDLAPEGVSKGSALRDLGRTLGIDVANMLAFGDEANDRAMLDTVGHPYLMEGGNPELRGLNDRIRLCSSVEDELERLLAETEAHANA